jgi:hypothetical protein
MKEMKGHTREGPTSGIIMNGMGPNPMAKDLGNRVSGKGIAKQGDTCITKVSIEMLEMAVMPRFKP